MNTVSPEPQPSLSALYEADEPAWLEEMARLVAERRFAELDTEHLSEYLLDMAKREKREVFSRLTVLLTHLLKWEYQPEQRSNSWLATMDEQRNELGDLLESGTLRRYAEEILPRAYERAHRQATLQTGLAEETFPKDCPFSLDHLQSDE